MIGESMFYLEDEEKKTKEEVKEEAVEAKEEEVVEYANSTEYGLAASIWTSDLNKAHRMGRAIKSGIVWINCWLLRDLRTPFGGMKNSGVGREGGLEALRFFTEPPAA